jgi:hypothetical protein
MKKTLYGYNIEKNDYADIYAKAFVEEFIGAPAYEISVNENTDHGFSTNEKIGLISGIYLIYKQVENQSVLVYVGHSGHCIRQRIGRWLSGIRGTERFDENHSAAYKYVEYFGRDTDGLSFKYIAIQPESLEHDLVIEDIEKLVIERMQPLFNGEIYKEYRFQKVLKITDIFGKNNERVVPL